MTDRRPSRMPRLANNPNNVRKGGYWIVVPIGRNKGRNDKHTFRPRNAPQRVKTRLYERAHVKMLCGMQLIAVVDVAWSLSGATTRRENEGGTGVREQDGRRREGEDGGKEERIVERRVGFKWRGFKLRSPRAARHRLIGDREWSVLLCLVRDRVLSSEESEVVWTGRMAARLILEGVQKKPTTIMTRLASAMAAASGLKLLIRADNIWRTLPRAWWALDTSVRCFKCSPSACRALQLISWRTQGLWGASISADRRPLLRDSPGRC